MQPASTTQKWSSILLMIGNFVGLLFYLSGAVLMSFSGISNLILPVSGMADTSTASFLLAFGLGLFSLAFLPAVIFSLQRVRGKIIPVERLRPIRIWQFILIGTAWAGAALISNTLYVSFKLGWLAAVPFYLLSISLPVFLLTWLGTGGIPIGSRNRFWSTLSISMTAGPFLAILLEFFIYAGVFLSGIIVLALNPDWMVTVNQLNAQLSGVTDLNKIVEILSPYLMNPVIIVVIFLVMAVITPMIEEAIKPIAVWLLASKLQNPAEGFALGVVSGAGFALIEGLLASSSPDQGWGILLAARAGGSLMHILASGLMGWAIASAWQGKRMRLLWVYPLCITIHGLWNSAAVVIELGTIQDYLKGVSTNSTPLLSLIGAIFLGVLILVILTVLFLFNRKIRPSPAIIPQENSRVLPG
jgi:hypothetical protein